MSFSNIPVYASRKTKAIRGMKNEYRLVSLPTWAWYWLEDYACKKALRIENLARSFGKGKELDQALEMLAEIHRDETLRRHHNLANDNQAPDDLLLRRMQQKASEARRFHLPAIYKLFGFMPCPTTLNAVWERKNIRGSLKIN